MTEHRCVCLSVDTRAADFQLQVTDIEAGAPVMAAAISPDSRIVTLQRSPERLEFVSRDSPNLFVQSAWRGKSAITGFFWARSADCDFVMVTSGGLELYTLAADRQVWRCTCSPLLNVKPPSRSCHTLRTIAARPSLCRVAVCIRRASMEVF